MLSRTTPVSFYIIFSLFSVIAYTVSFLLFDKTLIYSNVPELDFHRKKKIKIYFRTGSYILMYIESYLMKIMRFTYSEFKNSRVENKKTKKKKHLYSDSRNVR